MSCTCPPAPRLSSSRAKGRVCGVCQCKDVRGMPSPVNFKRYRSFKCAGCGNTWTQGHRGYTALFERKPRVQGLDMGSLFPWLKTN